MNWLAKWIVGNITEDWLWCYRCQQCARLVSEENSLQYCEHGHPQIAMPHRV